MVGVSVKKDKSVSITVSFPYSPAFVDKIKSVLGHRDVSTTMIYPHVLNSPGISVRSPLDG